jgi:hypothetical protein
MATVHKCELSHLFVTAGRRLDALKPFCSAAKQAGNKLGVTCRDWLKRSHGYDPHNVER